MNDLENKIFDIEAIKTSGNGKKVDVVVIGSGPAGYKVASILAQNKLQVVIIEKTSFGGTCVNFGCIPVKVFVHAGQILQSVNKSEDFGIMIDKSKIWVDPKKLNKKRWEVSEKLSSQVGMFLKSLKIEVIKGEAEILDKYNVKVNNKIWTTKLIFIATGSQPEILDLPGFKKGYQDGQIIDSKQILDLKEIPHSITIIGGKNNKGPTIDLNIAQIFSNFGKKIKITIIKEDKDIAAQLDQTIQENILKILKQNKIEVFLNSQIIKFEKNKIFFKKDNKEQSVESNKILVATKRLVKKNTLLEKLKIKINEEGFVKVNKFFQTNISNVFAIGDIVGQKMLAHESFKHALVAANYILNNKFHFNSKFIPFTSYSFPESASVGYNEQELISKKIDYIKGEFYQKNNPKSIVENRLEGFTKILIGKKYGEILGIHMMHHTAIDSINQATTLLELETTIEELVNFVHTHPTISESLWNATLITYNLWEKENLKS